MADNKEEGEGLSSEMVDVNIDAPASADPTSAEPRESNVDEPADGETRTPTEMGDTVCRVPTARGGRIIIDVNTRNSPFKYPDASLRTITDAPPTHQPPIANPPLPRRSITSPSPSPSPSPPPHTERLPTMRRRSSSRRHPSAPAPARPRISQQRRITNRWIKSSSSPP